VRCGDRSPRANEIKLRPVAVACQASRIASEPNRESRGSANDLFYFRQLKKFGSRP
jgi:hypothetical protein